MLCPEKDDGHLASYLFLTPAANGMVGPIVEGERLTKSNPDSFMPRQFKNAGHPEIHFKTTGPEIWVLPSEPLEGLKDAGSAIAVGMVSQNPPHRLFPPFLGAPWVTKITLPHFYGLIQVMKA
jgi:hypothetical protein